MRGVVQTDDARGHRRVRLLMVTAIALTLAVVAVAIGRLTLYTGAFGLTMLRLYSTIFAAWIGVVFVALGAAVTGVGSDRRWLLPFAAATGITTLMVLNVINVEARVVDYNVAQWQRVDRVDLNYLTTGLEADAIPALVAATQRLQPAQGAQLQAAICAGYSGDASNVGLSFNLAQHRANAALATACRSV